MKKMLHVIGILSIITGVILGTLEIIDSFSNKATVGNITNIFERKNGAEYSNVEVGNVYPCKLEITYKDNNGIDQIGKTHYEIWPCSSFFIYFYRGYYKVGDKVNIVYSNNDPSNIEINSLFDRFGFLITFSLFGLGLIYFSKRLH